MTAITPAPVQPQVERYELTNRYLRAIGHCNCTVGSIAAKICILAFPIIILITLFLDSTRNQEVPVAPQQPVQLVAPKDEEIPTITPEPKFKAPKLGDPTVTTPHDTTPEPAKPVLKEPAPTPQKITKVRDLANRFTNNTIEVPKEEEDTAAPKPLTPPLARFPALLAAIRAPTAIGRPPAAPVVNAFVAPVQPAAGRPPAALFQRPVGINLPPIAMQNGPAVGAPIPVPRVFTPPKAGDKGTAAPAVPATVDVTQAPGGIVPPKTPTPEPEPDTILPKAMPAEIAAMKTMMQVPLPGPKEKVIDPNNIEIYKETIDLALEQYADETAHLINGALTVEVDVAPPTAPGHYQTEIVVDTQSSMLAAYRALNSGLKPIAMDIANPGKAGGRVHLGANDQEATLCRQTNLAFGLRKMEENGQYPIPEFGGLLLKDVLLFRTEADPDPKRHYQLLATPSFLDVFAVSAYYVGNIPPNQVAGKFRAKIIKKLENFLNAAIKNENDTIIAGAIGCGAMKNDPNFIAGIYKEILDKPQYQGHFKQVIFAIPQDPTGKVKNFEAFEKTFN